MDDEAPEEDRMALKHLERLMEMNDQLQSRAVNAFEKAELSVQHGNQTLETPVYDSVAGTEVQQEESASAAARRQQSFSAKSKVSCY